MNNDESYTLDQLAEAWQKQSDEIAHLADRRDPIETLDTGALRCLRRRKKAEQLASAALCLATAVLMVLFFRSRVLDTLGTVSAVLALALVALLLAQCLHRFGSATASLPAPRHARPLGFYNILTVNALAAIGIAVFVLLHVGPVLGYGPLTADASQMINTINQTLTA